MRFVYDTGLSRRIFRNVRLCGGWDADGRVADHFATVLPMREHVTPDGAFAYDADVGFGPVHVGRRFRWSVLVDGPAGPDLCGVASEGSGVAPEIIGDDPDSCHRTFHLTDPQAEERYFLTHLRRLGAHEHRTRGAGDDPGIRFSVWAPRARRCEVVFGTRACGYIADDGSGLDPERPPVEMRRAPGGVWFADASCDPRLGRFRDFVGVPYMYRIHKDPDAPIQADVDATSEADADPRASAAAGAGAPPRGKTIFVDPAYRTDLYSRSQLGTGETNPHGAPYAGGPDGLDGSVSCSVVVDLEVAGRGPDDDLTPKGDPDVWREELHHAFPVPHRLEDLVIYELHVGSLGYGHPDRPGNFDDATALLDYLGDLGVNAIELLPVAEFNGTRTWGYGNSHHFAIQSSSGGRDALRAFVRACHRRGVAVIADVVYNHFAEDGERSAWHYDSDREDHNIYYWYEGRPDDYPSVDGGYVDNVSSGWAPRLDDEMVRKLFISSAVALVEELHVDGFRVDQTTSLHAYNVLHADGTAVPAANIAGASFLRELSRTLRLVRPSTLLIAEDHSEWPMVGEPTEVGGLGFDGFWYAAFYHHLVGDGARGPEYARLLATAGHGGDGDLAMDRFAGALGASGRRAIVYHESHDEAGNGVETHRTMLTAVNATPEAPPAGELRQVAEARCRFAAGMALLSAGTPMFLMGEEIGAAQDFRYDDFIHQREDLRGARAGDGARLYAFYQDLIRLRLRHPALTSRNIEVVWTHNSDRVIAFRRWRGAEEMLVVATLSNAGWPGGYRLQAAALAPGAWRELFTSDARRYGGSGVSHGRAAVPSDGAGTLTVKLPARGVIVLRRIAPV